MKNKTSEAKLAANKRWAEKNKARKQYINRRSIARSFIRDDAVGTDLDELEALIQERRQTLAQK
ncbi:hypothetical protein [Schleiferilactobacillus shenzhenensis]|uniref:hypothetical protein n=1 Tax=Schleiferilactobacillus shenzhenensis TaxID=1231337 RepID=UPI00042A723E|nr:hypothetical protein [Schleiferilactobacillus shenzhenensis]